RTSPTNMGLALLSNLSAYDFGYIPAGELLERTARAFDTMKSLERHRGHFFNWYDTQALKVLPPAYVSSVDSGNLAVHLLTLRPGLLGLADQKILADRCLEGIQDTYWILLDVAGDDLRPQLDKFGKDLEAALSTPPATLAAARSCLEMLAIGAAKIADGL